MDFMENKETFNIKMKNKKHQTVSGMLDMKCNLVWREKSKYLKEHFK